MTFHHQIATPNTWRCSVVVITTAHPHSSKPDLRFCAGSNPALQWSRLEIIRLNAFCRSTIPNHHHHHHHHRHHHHLSKINLVCSPHLSIEPKIERSLIIKMEKEPYCFSVFVVWWNGYRDYRGFSTQSPLRYWPKKLFILTC